MKRNFILINTLIAILLIINSCTSTQVISSWSISNPPTDAMQKVLVLGVMADREVRDQIELTMTRTLNSDGVNANTATSVFGPKRLRDLKEEDIVKTLKNSDYTAVMIVSLVQKEKERNYVPPTYYSYPYMGYYRFYRRYWYVYDRVYTPGYYTTSTNWVLEADIYTIDEDELIYSTQTRSYDPNNANDLAVSFTKSIVTELKAKNIIPRK